MRVRGRHLLWSAQELERSLAMLEPMRGAKSAQDGPPVKKNTLRSDVGARSRALALLSPLERERCKKARLRSRIPLEWMAI
jgi:hypothetical protein